MYMYTKAKPGLQYDEGHSMKKEEPLLIGLFYQR